MAWVWLVRCRQWHACYEHRPDRVITSNYNVKYLCDSVVQISHWHVLGIHCEIIMSCANNGPSTHPNPSHQHSATEAARLNIYFRTQPVHPSRVYWVPNLLWEWIKAVLRALPWNPVNIPSIIPSENGFEFNGHDSLRLVLCTMFS